MVINNDTVTGKWSELTGEVKKKWGELTDDEVTRTNGNIESLVGVIQQKYGAAKEAVRDELNTLLAKFRHESGDSVNQPIDNAKDSLRETEVPQRDTTI